LDLIFLEGEQTEVKRAINSPLSTTVLLLNAMIGSGILVQAYAFKNTGIFLTTMLYIIISALNYFGVLVLIRTAEFTGYFDYALVAMAGLGPIGAMAVDLSIVLLNAGSLVSYILVVGDLLYNVVLYFQPTATGWYISETFFSAAVMVLLVMPICLVRRFGHLAMLSYMAVVVTLLIILLVCVDGPIRYADTKATDALRWFDFDGALDNIGSLVFSMGYTPSVLHAYVALDDKQKKVFPKITLLATFLGASLCFITGIVGYLCFRDDTDSNILDNFNGIWGTMTKFAVVIHLIFYIPGDFIVMRSSIYHLFQYSRHQLSSRRRPALFSNRMVDNSMDESESDPSGNYGSFVPPKRPEFFYLDEHGTEIRLQHEDDEVMALIAQSSQLDEVTEQDNTEYILTTVALVLFITIISCVIEFYSGPSSNSLSFVVNLTGGIAGSLCTFIFPGLCGMAFFHHKERYYHRSLLVFVSGIIISLMVMIGSVS
jgi:amino acid permease